MYLLFLLADITEFYGVIYFLHYILIWLIRELTLRDPPYCKTSCILVSKRVMSPTSAISDLSDCGKLFQCAEWKG